MISGQATSNETFPDLGDDRFNWREIGSFARELNLDFIQGICLPASCSVEKVLNYANEILNAADLIGLNAICRTNDPTSPALIDYFAL